LGRAGPRRGPGALHLIIYRFCALRNTPQFSGLIPISFSMSKRGFRHLSLSA
jgi:hypothetical protein